ncbi:MAG TPA: molybdopterin-synthase adenylyltransferase MoeB [Thermoanaerobaculia bacterium]|nr:molybdopterin-synthase adenylyltransferase MoeB [Thermoanaerobaculia bacterium]
MTRVFIPTPLRPYAGKSASVEVDGKTVGEALADLTRSHGGLRRHLYTEEGRLRTFVNVYVNDSDIRYLQKEETPLGPGDTISIVPSVAGGSVAAAEPLALSNEEIRRYSRHLIMPEVGLDGQRKLKAARVLCIGAGGLGSPATLYLAAAGIGAIGLVDFDVVDFSNLQRQILHGTSDVGRLKLESAEERLSDINPGVRIERHEAALTSENALDILRDYDVVVDGTDNFPTRYLVNDACVLLGKPNVYGSIFRFEGQASVFATEGGPCYRCLYAEPPPPGLVPSCAEGGVLGVLPGIIGTIQATEAIKLILGAGDTLAGRLLLFDALGMRFRELKLRRDPQCPICGDRPTIRELIDYEDFCGVTQHDELAAGSDISVEELKEKLDRKEDVLILDVREPQEYQINRIPGSILIPLGELPERVHELDSAREIVVHCKVGPRSTRALEFLKGTGFRRVRNLHGGIVKWVERIDPGQPVY